MFIDEIQPTKVFSILFKNVYIYINTDNPLKSTPQNVQNFGQT